jgi:parallel beta-helix repeat protein
MLEVETEASFGNKTPTTIAKRQEQMNIRVLFALSTVLAGVLSGFGICTAYAQGGKVREIGLPATNGSSDTSVNATIQVQLPISITEPGNYRLNTNLVGAGATSTVISIESSDVTLDLNGFSISSPGGTAISASGQNIAISNGSINPGDGAGVTVSGSNCRIEGLRIAGGRDGMFLSGTDGTNSNCIVKNNTVEAVRSGISCSGCVVSGNTVTANLGSGISCSGCVVSGNTVTGFLAINASNSSLVVGNRAIGGFVALQADDTTGYAQNVLRGTNADVMGGVQIGENLCVTSKICPP